MRKDLDGCERCSHPSLPAWLRWGGQLWLLWGCPEGSSEKTERHRKETDIHEGSCFPSALVPSPSPHHSGLPEFVHFCCLIPLSTSRWLLWVIATEELWGSFWFLGQKLEVHTESWGLYYRNDNLAHLPVGFTPTGDQSTTLLFAQCLSGPCFWELLIVWPCFNLP